MPITGVAKLVALGLDARIIPAQMVLPYQLQGKSGKNNANDAAAICEAASHPQMHFVTPKTIPAGTPIAGRPPHRSEHAQFTHSAPTLGA